MALFILVIAVILIVAAVRNSQADLFSALKTDVPEFAVWAAAIVAIGMLGYVPGLKPISRGLLGLIILVIVLTNYKNIISGFDATWNGSSSSGGSSGQDVITKAMNAASSLSTVAPGLDSGMDISFDHGATWTTASTADMGSAQQ